MSYFSILSLVLQHLQCVHELTLVLSDLVKFLVPGFKVTYQSLSALAMPCILQITRSHKSMHKSKEEGGNKTKDSINYVNLTVSCGTSRV